MLLSLNKFNPFFFAELAGRNEWEKAKVDELVSLQKDFYAALSPWFYAKVGAKDPEKVSFPRYDNFAESEQKKNCSIFGVNCKLQYRRCDIFQEPELFETVAKPVTERFFKLYSQLLRTHKGGFYVGNKETFVDFWIADFLYTLKNYAPELFEQHQDLLQHVERVQQLPQLKAYIENRPKRDF